MICSVNGCDKKPYGKGLCKLHYQRLWRLGTTSVTVVQLRLPLNEKFWYHTDKKLDAECWEWKGNKDKDGYGTMMDKRKFKRAHRVSWELHNGQIPKGMMVLHNCHNPGCVNPNHLRLGDHNENMRDRHSIGNYPAGEDHPQNKYSFDLVQEIRESNETIEQISVRTGVSQSQVSNIKRGAQRVNN